MTYEELKALFFDFANTEEILKDDFIDLQVLNSELSMLELKYEDDHNYYYALVNEKDMQIKSKEGKVWNIPMNMVLKKTAILTKISTSTLKDYKGRAKALLKGSKQLIQPLKQYFDTFIIKDDWFNEWNNNEKGVENVCSNY